MKILFIVLIIFLSITSQLDAQHWRQNDYIFNPSGIPSLTFSQPRLADLDGDGDFDLVLGSISEGLMYFTNSGSVAAPSFQPGPDIFSQVPELDAEMAVFHDLDNDGDADMVCGGFTGLNYYVNNGDSSMPVFQKIPGAFSGLDVGSNPVPAFADMDNDGCLDMLVGLSEDGSVKFYPNSGTAQAFAFSESSAQTWFDVGLYAYPWLGDLDNDGDYDLLCGRDVTGFKFYRNTGDSSGWQWQDESGLFAGPGQSTYWNSGCLVDLNNDGKKDLVYGTASGPLNYFVNTGSLATPAWTANNTLFGGVLDVGGASSPCMVDFDSDGDFDLVSGSQLGQMKYYKNTGTPFGPAWAANHTRFATILHSIYSAVTLADVTGDGMPDAVAGDLSGNLFFHRNTGVSFSYSSTTFSGINFSGWSAPRLVDMDSDGDMDLVVGNEAGNLFYLANTGRADSAAWHEVAGFFGGIDVGSNCVPAPADVDGDGDIDIITGDLFGEVQYFEQILGTWVEKPNVVAGVSGGQNSSPALADLDGDGDPDLVLGNYDGTFNYFENVDATFIPAGENEFIPNGFRVDVPAPNPFNGVTVFRCKLARPAEVRLSVYTVRGQEIISIPVGHKAAGAFEYRLVMPARLSSGVYFYRFTTSLGQLEKGRIVYLK
jgi:hypothetical protein